MLRTRPAPVLRIAAGCALLVLSIAAVRIAHAQVIPKPKDQGQVLQIQMRMDGISGPGSVPSALGPDAFPLVSFTLPVGRDESNTARPAVSGPPTPEDISFNMGVTGPAVQLWQYAMEGKVVPKASLAAFDPTGKIRYRVDLEQVVVRSFGLQTMGINRETIVGTLGYERIRVSTGEGKDAVSASWSRSRAAKD